MQILVDTDTDVIRRDFVSTEIMYAYPLMLLVTSTAQDRNLYLQKRDAIAYLKICNKYPKLRPPRFIPKLSVADYVLFGIEDVCRGLLLFYSWLEQEFKNMCR